MEPDIDIGTTRYIPNLQVWEEWVGDRWVEVDPPDHPQSGWMEDVSNDDMANPD